MSHNRLRLRLIPKHYTPIFARAQLCKGLIKNLKELAAIVGAKDSSGVNYILNHLETKGYIWKNIIWGEINQGVHQGRIGVTYDGWIAYEEVKRHPKNSRQAFMAMPFGKKELDQLFPAWKSAVGQTDFTLKRVDENPKAGSIINRIKADIRNSRFLVAELTGNNPNVYWEAGFAEGLGIPVIYTCEKNFFEKTGTTFDTRSDHTILWEKSAIPEAQRALKDCIRATLPGEAKQNDEASSKIQELQTA